MFVTDRPAELLPPEMEKAREETKGLARDIGDVLTYALYSNTGKQFLQRKYGSEAYVPK
jgi:pyruvate/oxaloacetate carboxyltransferase